MADTISIKVNIADRIFPLQVSVKEEEMVRKAAKLLQQKVQAFNTNYQTKDAFDGLALAALDYAVDALKKTQKVEIIAQAKTDLTPIQSEIDAINNLLR